MTLTTKKGLRLLISHANPLTRLLTEFPEASRHELVVSDTTTGFVVLRVFLEFGVWPASKRFGCSRAFTLRDGPEAVLRDVDAMMEQLRAELHRQAGQPEGLPDAAK